MNYKIAQFILTPPQRGGSVHEIYVAQPDANKEALAGKLFALIEIESNKADSLKVINFLINALNHNYYQNEKMILRERVASIKIEHIFESALAKTNKRLAEFLQSEKIKFNSSLANITIGVVYNDSLHFSNLGKNKALLIYKNKTEENAKYKLADITEQTDGREAKKNISAIKLFSNVVSGSLPRGGYFIFANETFSEYLSAKQILSIITALPPAGAAEQIKNTLNNINAYVPFLGIIIKNTAGELIRDMKTKQPIAATTKASVENLIATEERTEKLLTPPGLINTGGHSSFFSYLADHLPNLRSGKNKGSFILKDKIFSGKKSSWFSFNKILNFFKTIVSYLAAVVIYVYKILSDRKRLAEAAKQAAIDFKRLLIKIKTGALNLFYWYKNLNKINKILFSAFLLCLFIFSANLIWQTAKNNNIASQSAANELITAVEQKQNQIDASLLYNNEDGAKKLLDEVKGLLAQLPQKNQDQKDLYNKLMAKNGVQMEKISRVLRVNPTELTDFTRLNANAKPTSIIFGSQKIYAADAAQKAVYSFDSATKLTTSINLSGQNVSRLDFPSQDKNNNISYFNSNNVIVIDGKSDAPSTLSVNFTSAQPAIIDLKQYNNRYYLVDANSGQVYRFTNSGGKLTNATAWLNSKEDLNNTVGMDIDGSVYLLNKNGRILKYNKGAKVEFALTNIEPAISQASKLIVSQDQDYLYILEPANKRLIVFNKSGLFINQYTSDQFTDLKDFTIDEKGKKIYFLNGAKVYLIDAVHLESKK